MTNNARNCRCCGAYYEKPMDQWSDQYSAYDDDGNKKDPVGFCEFCDRNNNVWYMSNKSCHAVDNS